MASVNTINTRIDPTVRIFDDFYNFEQVVPVNEYDAVNSFFQSIYGTGEAAANFTVTLFRIAAAANRPVLDLLDEMDGQTRAKITANMAYYLNGTRSLSTLLGINVIVKPNVWAARNVMV